jgi:hypothetical protein
MTQVWRNLDQKALHDLKRDHEAGVSVALPALDRLSVRSSIGSFSTIQTNRTFSGGILIFPDNNTMAKMPSNHAHDLLSITHLLLHDDESTTVGV